MGLYYANGRNFIHTFWHLSLLFYFFLYPHLSISIHISFNLYKVQFMKIIYLFLIDKQTCYNVKYRQMQVQAEPNFSYTNTYPHADVNPQQNSYPFCVVWTLLPCISWLLPWIGHTGICDDKGTIYDFLGFHINKKQMAFGNPKKYVRLQIARQDVDSYLKALDLTNSSFCNLAHDLCSNNCHHHVAQVLNLFEYRGRKDWSQVSVWWICLWESKYTSWWSPIAIYLPFILITLSVILISALTKK